MADKQNGLIFYQTLSEFRDVLHFTTTKIFPSKNSVRYTGDSEEIYIANRLELATLLGLEPNQFVFPRQTHSDQIAIITKISEKELSGVDALITNKPNICLCIQTADCVPILLYDQKAKAIGVVHAGWRGTVNHIISKTIFKMSDSFNVNPSDLIACVGPSIGPQVYEVGKDVIDQVEKNIPYPKLVYTKAKNGRALLNLWKSNKQLLIKAGVNEKNISISGKCTYSESNLFFSARREGIGTGRMVTGIMLKE